MSSALYKTKQQNVRIKSVAPLASRQNFLILKSYWYMTLLEWPTDRNSWQTWPILLSVFPRGKLIASVIANEPSERSDGEAAAE